MATNKTCMGKYSVVGVLVLAHRPNQGAWNLSASTILESHSGTSLICVYL